MLVVAKAIGTIFHYERHGVWVPAFAGTTLKESRAASRGELLRFKRGGLLIAQFMARELAD
jgi:hypothetical protein